MTRKIVLTYFDMADRAEPIRQAFKQGNIAFEDVRIDFKDFKKLKPQLPMGCLPIMEIDGEIMIESTAMLLYAGELSNLLPKSPMQKARVNEAIEVSESITIPLGPSFEENDQEKKLALRKQFVKGPMTSGLKYLESRVSGTPWMVGDSLTVADLKVAVLINWFMSGELDGITKDDIKGYTKLIALKDAVEKKWKQ